MPSFGELTLLLQRCQHGGVRRERRAVVGIVGELLRHQSEDEGPGEEIATAILRDEVLGNSDRRTAPQDRVGGDDRRCPLAWSQIGRHVEDHGCVVGVEKHLPLKSP